MSLSAWGQGDYLAAEQYGRAGFERFFSISHGWGIATGLSRIGFALLGQGKLDEADELFRQALQHSLEYGYHSTASYALIGLGAIWSQQGNDQKAAAVLNFCLENPATPAIYKNIARQELAKLSNE